MIKIEKYKSYSSRRSPLWPKAKREHFKIKKNQRCAVCGRKSRLQVHHIIPFHLAPQWELKKSNLITLCTRPNVLNCHLVFGHLGNFRSFNENLIEDVKSWFNKFKNRPKK